MAAGVALAIAGAWALGHHQASADEAAATKTALSAPAEKADVSKNPMPNFSDIVSKYGPAVVHIETAHGLGSGFIVSSDGYILTNHHVVADADQVAVKLADGRKFPARVIGSDSSGDVAVLKIGGNGLPAVKIGNPANSRVGDWVVAIGSPYGLDNTVTSGIISAKSRTLSDDTSTHFIQTDVPVNPGNSGGPLFNLNGEVIGINSMIYSRTGGFQGLSFAIPIDEAMRIKEQIVQNGHVSRARLGVAVQAIDAATARELGLTSPRGALVARVESGSPAQAAGVAPGDVIVGFNGRAIASPNELLARVSELEPGAQARLTVQRDGATRTLSVVASGDSLSRAAPQARAPQQQSHPRLGVAVRSLSGDEAAQLGVDGGVLVVRATGPAAAAGINAGDVILAVNGVGVANAEQLQQMIAQAGGDASIVVARDGEQLTIDATLAS